MQQILHQGSHSFLHKLGESRLSGNNSATDTFHALNVPKLEEKKTILEMTRKTNNQENY